MRNFDIGCDVYFSQPPRTMLWKCCRIYVKIKRLVLVQTIYLPARFLLHI